MHNITSNSKYINGHVRRFFVFVLAFMMLSVFMIPFLNIEGKASGQTINNRQSFVEGIYQLKNVQYATYMEVINGGTTNTTRVQLNAEANTDYQRFYIKAARSRNDNECEYYILPVHAPGKSLDVPGWSTANNTPIEIYTHLGTSNPSN